MAPWPEQGNEPKAPDKNSDKCENIALDDEVKSRIDSAETPDSNIQPTKPDQYLWGSCGTGAESGQFSDLDEGQLKALLEEAITYKSPKDRETKSVLFKELLQEAEADESDCSDETAAAAVASSGPSCGSRSHLSGSRLGSTKRRHGKRDVGVAERQRSGGSLQNLVHASRGTSGRHARDHVTGSVSARQREGGSLPTNVNVQGVELEDVTHSTELVCNYTSRATLQVSEDPHHVDMAVSFPISPKQGSNTMNGMEQAPLQLHSSYNSVKCVMGSNSEPKMAVSGAAESTTVLYPVQHVSFLSIPPQQIPASLDMNRIAPTKDASGEKKTVDENGNALASNRLETVTTDRKGKRRIKMKNYRNIVPAEKIEGHRGEDNIDSLIQYIESPSGNSVDQNKAGKARQANGPMSLVSKGTRGVNKIRAKEDEGRKRRSKETKIHKCNSLEEISKTKLEDLTSPSNNSQEETARARPKKQVTLDDAQLSMRSFDEQSNIALEDPFSSCTIKKKEEVFSDDGISFDGKKKKDKKPEGLSESVPGNEFHLVQKKQRRKKRQVTVAGRTNSGKGSSGYYGGRGFSTHDRVERDGRSLYRYRHSTAPQESVHPRRKSASSVPPSDNSDCSDEGSVCSLPVSSTTPRPNVGKTSTSGGSTPQASYADIARSVTSPPRAACSVNLPRRSTPASTVPSSAASSGIGDEEPSASPEPVLQCSKKDAMTDTNLDTFLPIEEYPPLKGPTSDLVFVECTVKRGRLNRDSSVSAEETVVVKINPCQNSQKSSHNDSGLVLAGAGTKTPSLAPVAAGTTPVTNKRPPVILLDEGRASPQSSSVTELTFGFEVNQQLLCDDDSAQSPSSMQAEPSLASSPAFYHEKLVNYIRSSWNAVEKEHDAEKSLGAKAKVQYYSGQ